MHGPVALGFVPDVQLWFDASDNPAHPEGCTNLGSAGRLLVGNDKSVLVLQPNAGPNGEPACAAKEEAYFYGRNSWGLLHPDTTPIYRYYGYPIVACTRYSLSICSAEQCANLVDRHWG